MYQVSKSAFGVAKVAWLESSRRVEKEGAEHNSSCEFPVFLAPAEGACVLVNRYRQIDSSFGGSQEITTLRKAMESAQQVQCLKWKGPWWEG